MRTCVLFNLKNPNPHAFRQDTESDSDANLSFAFLILPGAPRFMAILTSSHQFLSNKVPSWMAFKKAKLDYFPNNITDLVYLTL